MSLVLKYNIKLYKEDVYQHIFMNNYASIKIYIILFYQLIKLLEIQNTV